VIELSLSTSRREEMVDVTGRVRDAVVQAGVAEGHCLVYTPHTTCSVTVNEGYDPDVRHDLLEHMRELAPQMKALRHAEGNSDAHLKAMLVGASALLPVSGGKVRLGRWQAIFLCEFDGPRTRSLWITVR
jgi:secondary thiamine-phosphate synthase enzyme